MYKTPQLSDQAKFLRAELGKLGAEIPHARALELVARLQGARTLHVAQAKNNAPVSIEGTALAQASALMFSTLGRFSGNVQGLLASIQAAFELEASEGSRAVEQAVQGLFSGDNPPKVSAMFDSFRLSELPAQFKTLVESLTQTLATQARSSAQLEATADNVVFEGPARDWRLMDGFTEEQLPKHHLGKFDFRVTRAPSQLFVDLAPSGVKVDELNKGTVPQMTLFVEINEGRPCVHMSNSIYGDQVLTVFFTPDGLYLRPDESNLTIRTGVPHPETDLHTLYQDLRREAPGMISFNEAFIPA